MLEALWSVEFGAAGGTGTGIVVLETGRVLGGDTQYVYTGSYRLSPDGTKVEADVHVRKFKTIPGGGSVFGPAEQFNLKVSGEPNRIAMMMSGYVVENPALKIGIRFQRRAELPNPS